MFGSNGACRGFDRARSGCRCEHLAKLLADHLEAFKRGGSRRLLSAASIARSTLSNTGKSQSQ